MILRTVGNVKHFISSVFLCLGFGAFAQNPNINRADNWYFGDFAGISFASGSPVSISNGQLSTGEGCTSMSDTAGNLLFYTDGVTVWNKLHQPMAPSGLQLGGSSTTTNSAVTFPNPYNSNMYYIITAGAMEGDVLWSLVDMSLDGGLGQIVGANQPLLTKMSERVGISENCDRTGYLTYALRGADEVFFPLGIMANGISIETLPSTCPYTTSEPSTFQGTLKLSPNGNFIVETYLFTAGTRFYLVNDLSREVYYVSDIPQGSYGAEFSNTSNSLFISRPNGPDSCYGVAVTANQILQQIPFSTQYSGIGTDLQLGRNGKVYLGENLGLGEFQSASNFPNINYSPSSVPFISGAGGLKLPSFPSSWFAPERFRICYTGSCPGEEYNFFVSGQSTPDADSVLWDFGEPGNPQNNANGVNATHIYEQPGIRMVTAIIQHDGITDTVVKYVFTKQGSLSPGTVKDTIICQFNDKNFLQVPEDHRYACPTYSSGLEPGLNIQGPGTYFVSWDNGCAATVTDTIHVLPCPTQEELPTIPNIITPNADQTNDLIQLNLEGITELSIVIYNRWGTVVKKHIHYNPLGQSSLINLWDGMCWQTPCVDGVYFYVFDYTFQSGNHKQQKGTITVSKGQ
jgi:gliding motility-associated-like protein